MYCNSLDFIDVSLYQKIEYTFVMEQDKSDEEKAIEELEKSQDDEDSEELLACSE